LSFASVGILDLHTEFSDSAIGLDLGGALIILTTLCAAVTTGFRSWAW
jgi:hypothetical protein